MKGRRDQTKKFEKKKKIINRGPRVSKDETQDIIDRIPALSGLFTRLHQKFEMADSISKAVDLREEEEEKGINENIVELKDPVEKNSNDTQVNEKIFKNV